MTHGPVRTCIGCRTRRPQTSLCRLARRRDGQVVFATSVHAATRTMGGRGAYVCPRRRCVRDAVRRRAFGRAWARTGRVLPVDGDALCSSIATGLRQTIDTLVRSSRPSNTRQSITREESQGPPRRLEGLQHALSELESTMGQGRC